MRVLQIMAGAEFGGAEVFFVRLVIALHKIGLEQRVIIRHHPARAKVLREAGIEPIELPFGGLMDFQTVKVLKREIKIFCPDVTLTWMNRASKIFPKGKTVHVGRLGGYYNLKYYRKCSHLVANTKKIHEYIIREGWPSNCAHYLPNFVPGAVAKPVNRKEFYTPDKASLIVAVGRLHKNKAFDILLEAMALVQGAYLWIVGDGPLRQELELKAEELGVKPRIRFLGWREDSSSLIASGDIFICPSRHEPLGNVVLEAWAQTIPVVAANSSGPKALIKDNETGVLFPVDDVSALAKAIKDFLKDDAKRSRIALQGNQVFKKKFTEKKVVAQYLEFFRSVIQEVDAVLIAISENTEHQS
jgi:glycosyltransferase involved in cell wall biosynthesis